jgi:hypothetical protein
LIYHISSHEVDAALQSVCQIVEHHDGLCASSLSVRMQ